MNQAQLRALKQLRQGVTGTQALQRAQALLDTLARAKVDAKRLSARRVASLAPVARNAAEVGRARNRRVELVVPCAC